MYTNNILHHLQVSIESSFGSQVMIHYIYLISHEYYYESYINHVHPL